VVHVSGKLANRDLLGHELASIDAEVFLIELKAAAVDVVAEAALVKGAEIVLAANDAVSVEGEPDLDETLLEVAKFA
jgi:cyclic 2,3-diphosphoglycerate synthetase